MKALYIKQLHIILKTFLVIGFCVFGIVSLHAQSSPALPINIGSADQGTTGSVGLGDTDNTFTPRLDVQGSAYTQGLVTAGLSVFNGTSSASLGTQNNNIEFKTLSTGTNASHIQWGSNGDWYIRSALPTGKVILQDTGGNVGIGTSSPTQKLQVKGATLLQASGTIANGQGVNGILYFGDLNTYIRSHALNGSLRMGVQGADDAVVVNTSGTNVLAGSVNVGGAYTTAPANYRLNVDGLGYANTLSTDVLKVKYFKLNTNYLINSTAVPGNNNGVVWSGGVAFFNSTYTGGTNNPPVCNASTLGTIVGASGFGGAAGTSASGGFLLCQRLINSSGTSYVWYSPP